MRLAATSTEYVHVTVTAPDGVDLTGSSPRLAILPASSRDNPSPGDWHTGVWADGDARILIGPDGGTIELTAGDYWVWINVDPPGAEDITARAGILSIY